MMVIETIGGVLLAMSVVAFLVLAGFAKSFQARRKAEPMRGTGSAHSGVALVERAEAPDAGTSRRDRVKEYRLKDAA
jgi:hypothetical protein